jgi:5-methyltetrahydropteroyltriglutamate--homocysteine methyltransferase
MRTAVLGLPRMGRDRELKVALESFWAGRSGAPELDSTAGAVQADAWESAASHVDIIPVGDFSLYDHILDMAWALGVTPARFGPDRGLATYFAMARGRDDAPPLEMTKWFDTNYHYLVPELRPDLELQPRAEHWTAGLEQARATGRAARPVLVGPLTFLLLAKGMDDPLRLLDAVVEAYASILADLAAHGVTEVQLDEPVLALPRGRAELDRFGRALPLLSAAGPAISVATYFAGLDHDGALARLLALEPAELHLDLVRAPSQLEPALGAVAAGTGLSLGVVDGRNVWRSDLDRALALVDRAADALGGDRVTIASSCSLLHVPWSAARESGIDRQVRTWLAFADEKLAELGTLAAAAAVSGSERDALLAESREARAARRSSDATRDPAVGRRTAALAPGHYRRSAPYPQRAGLQRERLELPELPTTTIGSFPQGDEIRRARADHRSGRLDDAGYERFLKEQIAQVVEAQEQLGLDVLVHGEPERNDMVQYFAEQLQGFAVTEHGWVQSYGSRCVKPPILFGDVSRPAPMTVRWWEFAQSLTERPVKGMLTGPVTILQWSFVRDDQPLAETCAQIALAMQDEVVDLERAGAVAIQIDEAALREGLPLDPSDHEEYLRWAVDGFRLTVAPARPETQIHTHMCYSEFGDILDHIVRLDADVLSVEASRSGMDLLDAFESEGYPNEIGPGVYDIHSPRVPSVDEIETLLADAEARLGRERLWVNPDCGLKTRRWEDVMPALEHLVEAAHRRRAAQREPV